MKPKEGNSQNYIQILSQKNLHLIPKLRSFTPKYNNMIQLGTFPTKRIGNKAK